MRLVLRHATASHVGLVYDHNEDSAYAGRRLVAVADGVGGEVAGEVASGIAVAAIRAADPRGPLRPGGLRSAAATANQRIAAAVADDPALSGMATTLTAILLDHDAVRLAHVGDSRAYRLRDGEVVQLTRDDTFVQYLVDSGHLAIEDVPRHPHRNVVTRVLAGAPVSVTHSRLPARAGDRYLLCSDGLPDAVAARDIADTLRDVPDAEECADRLVNLALAGGGPDNVTVVVADLVAAPRRRTPLVVVLVLTLLLAVAGGAWIVG